MSAPVGTLLKRLFDAAIAAVTPAVLMPAALPCRPLGRTVVVGAGYAAAAMARAVEEHWAAPLEGLVLTPPGHGLPTRRIEVLETMAGTSDDETGRAAAKRILALVQGLDRHDLVLCLLSEGGEDCLSLPACGLTLDDELALMRDLGRRGADGADIATVRKHLSAIKGGRLAVAAAPARVVTLALSGGPDGDPALVAHGPTQADPTTFAQARAILARHGIAPSAPIARHLNAARKETVKPGDPRLGDSSIRVVASVQQALEAAAMAAVAQGAMPLLLGEARECEAREAARLLAGMALSVATHRQPLPPPAVLLSGGRTRLTAPDAASPCGRNAEFLLALALALNGQPGISAIAGDTRGSDAGTGAAGAILTPDTLARAAAAGLDAPAMLAEHQAHHLFAALGDLVETGPTWTALGDFRAILIE